MDIEKARHRSRSRRCRHRLARTNDRTGRARSTGRPRVRPRRPESRRRNRLGLRLIGREPETFGVTRSTARSRSSPGGLSRASRIKVSVSNCCRRYDAASTPVSSCGDPSEYQHHARRPDRRDRCGRADLGLLKHPHRCVDFAIQIVRFRSSAHDFNAGDLSVTREWGDPTLVVSNHDVQDRSGDLNQHDRSPQFQKRAPTNVLARFAFECVDRDHAGDRADRRAVSAQDCSK